MIYGEDRTIHQDGYFDVETRNGEVVAVWFRCVPVPFLQSKVDAGRAREMQNMYSTLNVTPVTGIVLDDEVDKS